MNLEIANRLLKLRKQNNLSQEELASRLGISRQAISKWERAEASPDTDNLISLSKLYGVSLDELLRTEDDTEIYDSQADNYTYEDNSSITDSETKSNENDKSRGGYGYTIIKDKSMDLTKSRKKLLGHIFLILSIVVGVILGMIKPIYPYPVYITIVYLILGFTFDYWHPGWIIYLTIPLYYTLIF